MTSIPIPPRDPSPPTPNDDHPEPANKFFSFADQNDVFLSPYKESFQIKRPSSLHSAGATPPSPYSPMVPFSPTFQSTSSDSAIQNGKKTTPFNFQPMAMSKSPITKSSVGQRRGHKYKHSSVSHQIFLEPAPRAPISLPNSLPIPTIRECWKSMSGEQRMRLYWSICHIIIAGFTLANASGSLALTSLSHLLLYDSFGAIICGMVDVFSNFEVWKSSSIRHPFGLERAEVLAGFAMSVLLVFMGMDLISHNAQHILEGAGSHEAHHSHAAHTEIPHHALNASAFFAILATTVSARILDNHARIGKVMRLGYFSNLPSILSNPSHFLTITCSFCLLLLSHVSIDLYKYLDHILSCTIALCMSGFGFRIVTKLGKMLLMTWTPSSNQALSAKETASASLVELVSTIESDPLVSRVEEVKVWQVHYGLCLANFKLRVRGEEENLTRLRDRLVSLVKNKLGGGYGSGAGRFEVNTELEREIIGAAPKRMNGSGGRGHSGLSNIALGPGSDKADGKAL